MIREEIQKRMDALAREFAKTHDPEVLSAEARTRQRDQAASDKHRYDARTPLRGAADMSG